MTVAKVNAQVLGSPNRHEAIIGLMMHGTDGEFAIVHQDGCQVMKGSDCSCVPSVWRITRGKA